MVFQGWDDDTIPKESQINSVIHEINTKQIQGMSEYEQCSKFIREHPVGVNLIETKVFVFSQYENGTLQCREHIYCR
jgi:hypothetical protein